MISVFCIIGFTLFSVVKSQNVGNVCTNSVGTRCTCNYVNGLLSVDCKSLGLTAVPVGIQQDAYLLDLSNNNIESIEYGDFNGLEELKVLLLSNNSITSIAAGAFDKLYNVETLSIFNNKLTKVESGYFRHLPSLVSLDLSMNKIQTFARDSLLYLPRLGLLSIKENPLQCDCEMRAFRQYLDTRAGDLVVLSAKCKGSSVQVTDLNLSQFGSCTNDDLFKSISCMNCKNVRSTAECIEKNFTTECLVNVIDKPTCFEELVYVSSGLIINKGCRQYSACLLSERENANQCYGQAHSTRCHFCCVGDLCNRQGLRGRLHASAYTATVTSSNPFPQWLTNTGSSTYKNFVDAVQSQVDNSLNNRATSYGSFVSRVISAGSPADTVKLHIELSTITEVQSDNRASFITQQIKSVLNIYTSAYPISSVEVALEDTKCLGETTSDSTGIYQWGTVNPGEVSVVPCPIQTIAGETASRKCTLDVYGVPEWDDPDTSACPTSTTTSSTTTTTRSIQTTTPSALTQSLTDLSNTQVTSNNADSIRGDLLQLSKQSLSYSEMDVKLSLDIVEGLLTEGSIYGNNIKSEEIVEAMSNILNSPTEAIEKSASIYGSAERFVKSVDRLTDGITPSSDDFTAVNDNLALLVRRTNPNNFQGLTMQATVKQGVSMAPGQIVIKDGEDPSSMPSGVVIPATIFNTGTSSPRVSFAVYRSDTVFKTVAKKGLSQPLVVPKNVQNISAINGPVISSSVQNTDVTGLTSPILLRFEHFNQNSERPQCVFIKMDGSSGMEWSNQGCRVKEHVPGSHTDCECDHMTNFALLMDIYQTGGSISRSNLLALTYISYIGCAVSLVGLLFTLFTYFMFRKLRVNNPSKILINLCLALAMTNIIFLVGMQEYTLDNDIGCKIVAVLLHYVLLSALSWMLVEAFYMYMALIKVFNTYFSHFLLKCCLFGWGVPLVIVAVTLGVNKTNNYGQQAGGICWLSPIPFYVAFLVPVGIILILNFITFILVFRTITKGSSKKLTKSDNKNNISQRLRGAVALIILLGLTWAFAIFAIDNGGIIFQYLFTIFNSLQGLFIFIFYCLLKTDAQQAWRKKCGCLKREYTGPTSTKEKSFDLSKGTASNTYTSDVSESKKDFSDLSKEIEASYPETKVKAKRYPSYTESHT